MYYFCLCCVLIAAPGLSLAAESRGSSLVVVCGLLVEVASLAVEEGSRHTGFSRSVWAQKLWCTNLVAVRHVGSSQTRDQTCVLCIGRRILYHWAPGKPQRRNFYSSLTHWTTRAHDRCACILYILLFQHFLVIYLVSYCKIPVYNDLEILKS